MDDMSDVLTDNIMSGLFASVVDLDEAVEYKIDMSYSKRLRVWRDQIIPDFILSIQSEKTEEWIDKVTFRLECDYKMLYRRAVFENVDIVELIVLHASVMRKLDKLRDDAI